MPSFRFLAVAADRSRITGVEEFRSVSEATRRLRERGFYPLEVAECPNAEPGGRTLGLRARATDLQGVFATLASLVGSGMGLERALAIAAETAARQDVRAALGRIRQRVLAGEPLSGAVAADPLAFPPVVAAMLAAGEQGGELGGALDRIGIELERRARFRSKLSSALLYPAILAAAAAVALGILVVGILPRFAELLEGVGSELPASTALLLSVGQAVRAHGMLGLALGLTAAMAAFHYQRRHRGRQRLHRLMLGLPWLGLARGRIAGAGVSRTTSTLLDSGVPLVAALRTAAGTCGDMAISADVERIRGEVERGEPLGAALARSSWTPPGLEQLARAGEATGELGTMLGRAADLLEADLERQLRDFLTLLEPLIIIFLGGFVGFVAASLLRAVYRLNAAGF